jgi:hypothetical protein
VPPENFGNMVKYDAQTPKEEALSQAHIELRLGGSWPHLRAKLNFHGGLLAHPYPYSYVAAEKFYNHKAHSVLKACLLITPCPNPAAQSRLLSSHKFSKEYCHQCVYWGELRENQQLPEARKSGLCNQEMPARLAAPGTCWTPQDLTFRFPKMVQRDSSLIFHFINVTLLK